MRITRKRIINRPEANKQKEQGSQVKIRRRAHNVFFLLDVSASMSVPDSRTGAARLDFAKEIADQIISQFQGEMGSLDAFTSEVTPLSPLTTDYLFLRLMLRHARINEGDLPGTDIIHAIEEMRNKYFTQNDSKLKTLILLSDGGDTFIESLQGEEREQAIERLLDLLGNTEASHLRVYTIGLGSLQGEDIPNLIYEGKPVHSALDEEILRKIARRGRGVYYPARDYTSIALAKDLVESMRQDPPFLETEMVIRSIAGNQKERLYNLYYQVPLGLALLLMGIVLLWPNISHGIIKIGKNFLFLAFFYPLNLMGSKEESFKEAALWFQANDYSHAEEIYEGLLEGGLTAWEKEVVQYNLGTSFLADGKYGKAIEVLKNIVGADLHPLLGLKIKTNLSFSLLGEADQFKKERIDQLEKSVYRYREALDEIGLALQADCFLQKIEGGSICHPDQNLKDLKTYAKVRYAAQLEQLMKLRIEQIDWADGIPLLILSLNQLMGEISLLESQVSDENLKVSYGNLIAKEAAAWQQLWESIKRKIANLNEEIFIQAKTDFDQGLLFLRKKEYASSRQSWDASLSLLKKLMSALFKGNPTQEVLRKLLAFYNYASVQTPLQESTLAALESEQESILPLIQPENRLQVEQAQKSLSKAYEALQDSKDSLGKFYVWHGRHLIRSLLRQLEPKASTPESILEEGRENLHDALVLNRLRMKNDDPDVLKIVQTIHKEVFDAVDPFLSSVMNLEKKEYQHGICQARPWVEVLPLFDEGVQAAKRAQLEKGDISLEDQELAYEKWGEALEKIRTPSPSSSGSCQGESRKREQQKNQEPGKPKNKNEKPQASMEEVLRQLIEMDQDDRLPKESQAIEVKGIKPW